jgi:hypothetical protein
MAEDAGRDAAFYIKTFCVLRVRIILAVNAPLATQARFSDDTIQARSLPLAALAAEQPVHIRS